jgi:hypothetical protein
VPLCAAGICEVSRKIEVLSALVAKYHVRNFWPLSRSAQVQLDFVIILNYGLKISTNMLHRQSNVRYEAFKKIEFIESTQSIIKVTRTDGIIQIFFLLLLLLSMKSKIQSKELIGFDLNNYNHMKQCRIDDLELKRNCTTW